MTLVMQNQTARVAAWLLGALLMAVPAAVAAPGLTARLDREAVPLGESVTLSLIFEDASPGATPNLPALPNLNLVSVSQRSEFNMVNGATTAKRTFDYTLAPTQPGDITIPAMRVQINGQVLTTQPLKLKVVQGNAAAANPQATATNLAFVRLVVPKTEVYLGEPFAVEIQLYWQNAQDIQMPQLQAEGFALGQPTRPNQTTTMVGGAPWNLAVFRLAATAAKTGLLTLGPVECNLNVLIPLNTPRRRDMFDPFGMFGPRMQARPTVLRSESQAMRVLPLPTNNVPDNFNGAVGSYTMNVMAGPTNLAVGDPITVKVQISGRGPLDALALPPQSWRDFKTYPATSKVEPNDPLGLSGMKTFEQVVIPQNHEITALPPFQFSFFDPAARSYRTLTHPPIRLTVRPTLAAAAPPVLTNTNAGQTQPPPADDILHIRARLDDLALVRPPLIRQPWFVALQGVPVLAWLSLLIRRKRGEALANNPRLRRQRQVAQRVREGLRELQSLAAARKADDFFATLFRLLQEQLGERLDLPASAITEAVIDEKLHGRELPEPALAELRELFQTCNQARYAPLKTSQELASLIPRLESVLRALQQMKGWET